MKHLARAVPLIAVLATAWAGIDVLKSFGEESALERFTYRQRHMGTLFQLTLYAGDEIEANRAAKAAFEKVRQLDEALSDYKPESELNRLSSTS